MEKIDKVYDIAVVGAGPAGSIAAGELARQGHSVVLIDKDEFPREKVCGDGLVGDSVRVLRKVGLWDTVKGKVHTSDIVELYPFENRSFTIDSSVHTLRRIELDKIIRDWAIGLGAEFLKAKFSGNIVNQDNLQVLKFKDRRTSGEQEVKAKYSILSMGCQPSSYVAQFINGDINVESDIVAIRGYCEADWTINHPMVFFRPEMGQGYVWIFPMGARLFNVGCGSKEIKVSLKKSLESFLQNSKHTSYAGYKWIETPRGAFLNTGLCNLDCAVNGRTLLAGETLGSTYPFTGEGIGKAMETGFLAAKTINDAISNDSPDSLSFYPDLLKQRILHSYKTYSFAEKILYKGKLSKVMFYWVCASKKIQSYIGDILSERKRAQDIRLFKFAYGLARLFSGIK